MYEHLMTQDEVAPLSQRETHIQSVSSNRYGGAGVPEAVVGHDAQHTMRYVT